jgi:PAS domain S-box-containing protein
MLGTHLDLIIYIGLALSVFLAAAVCFFRREEKNAQHLSSITEDVFNTLGRGVILFDEQGQFMQANDAAREFISLMGEPGHESKSSSPPNLGAFLNYMFDHAVEADESLRSALGKFSNQGGAEGFREVISWGGENLCLVESVRTASGRSVITLNDLSAVKRDEDQFIRLNQYSHKLTHAIEAVTSGIIIARRVSDSYEVVFANQAFYTQSGLSIDDVLGRDAAQIFDEFIQDDDNLEMLNAAMSHGTEIGLEFSSYDPVSPLWFNMKLTPIEAEDNDEYFFIAIFTDITELKMREADLSRTQKMDALGQLAAGVAHDFNNVLSIISGYSRMVQKSEDDKETTAQYMEKIDRATERGATLTSQLLTFSRHKIISKNVLDLSRVVAEQVAFLQPLIPSTINFSTDIEDAVLAVECSSDHVMQIIMNLAINARDSMKDGGDLMLSARRIEHEDLPPKIKEKSGEMPMVCLSVSDTGTGIDQATLDKIFDPFFTTKDQGKGTGLGLFMVYGLLNQMGGYIDVDSQPGEGSTFSVFWPLSDKEPDKYIEGDVEDIESINLKGYTALVAEDEPDLLLLVSDMLGKLGMTVLTAANGNEALLAQAEHEGNIDLLLTDVVMPELNGAKLAELFAEERPESAVIFMSGYPANAREINSPLPEDAQLMAKPLNYDTLARVIFRTLKQAQLGSLPGTHDNALPHWTSSDVVQKNKEVK